MKNSIKALPLLFFAVSAGAAAVTPRLVYPPAPDPARIEYLSSLARMGDLRTAPPRFFEKVWAAIVGNSENNSAVMMRPFGVCAWLGRICASDSSGGAVMVFDREKGRIWQVGRSSAQGALSEPMGLATDDEGNLYVADATLAKIMIYGAQGDFKGAIGIKGREKGMLWRPVGLAFDRSRKRLLVADAGMGRVLAYSLQGDYQGQIGTKGGGPGQLSVPVGVAVDSKGRILVTDTILCRVQVFDGDGRFVLQFGEAGDALGFFARPKGVAVDSEDNIYVVDALFSAVQIFDPRGKLLMHFGREGDQPGAFQLPMDISIDASDNIYIADSMNRRVEVYRYLKQPISQKGGVPVPKT